MAAPHDMHGVDSFRQLPFVRAGEAGLPPPPQPQPQQPDATIRLFGCDFSNDAAAGQVPKEEAGADVDGASAAAGEARKFECHYCCRNFPTSQALGGHQNAHKRERQHARRAHLEASLAAAHCGAYLQAPGHVYGLFGYGHQAAAMSPMPPPQYPVWPGAVPGMYGTGAVGSVPRSAAYGGMAAPMPGMWRPSPVGGSTGAFGAAPGLHGEATAAVLGSGELPGKDGKVVMSVVTSLPSLPSFQSGRSPAEIGRSELGQKEGVVSLDLCL